MLTNMKHITHTNPQLSYCFTYILQSQFVFTRSSLNRFYAKIRWNKTLTILWHNTIYELSFHLQTNSIIPQWYIHMIQRNNAFITYAISPQYHDLVKSAMLYFNLDFRCKNMTINGILYKTLTSKYYSTQFNVITWRYTFTGGESS